VRSILTAREIIRYEIDGDSFLHPVNVEIPTDLVEAYHRNEQERRVIDCKLKKIWHEAHDLK